MPTYIFKNSKTGTIFEKYLGMSELDKYKTTHPHFIQMPTILNAVGGIGGMKLDNGFKDLMNNIKRNTPGANYENY